MKPVPPGFNKLIEERARAVTPLLSRHVIPVCRLDAKGDPVFEGSAVPIRSGDRYVLASAAHVFDATVEGGIHLLLPGREQSPLENAAYATITSRPVSRTDDLIDLAYVPLTLPEVTAIGEDAFLRLDRPPVRTDAKWFMRGVLFGYPAKTQMRRDATLVYEFVQSRYTAPEISANKRDLAGLSEFHFAIGFDRRRIASSRGQGGQPNFVGMSGGGVWRLDPYQQYDHTHYPELIGFLVGPAPRNRKVLFGPRPEVLFEMFAREGSPVAT